VALYRRSLRRRRRSRWPVPTLLVVAIGAAAWWLYPGDDSAPMDELTLASRSGPSLESDRPEDEPTASSNANVAEKGQNPRPLMSPHASAQVAGRVDSLINTGKESMQRGDHIAARSYLSEAFTQTLDPAQAVLLRAELTRIGNETVFSPRILPNDPFVERYIIQTGDTLGKIAKANNLSSDLLANINEIKNKNRIRAGQTIKVIKGPFRVVVRKSTYTMDVYLGSTFVKHFKVGLGADDSTPTGEWRVATKLTNPTYYPPRGGRIVSADDPQNPLGERWIGLEGVSGEALGQHRYGIHGTIEPDTIGQSVSLGCIRMYNEDVADLYTYLVEKHSTVEVRN